MYSQNYQDKSPLARYWLKQAKKFDRAKADVIKYKFFLIVIGWAAYR